MGMDSSFVRTLRFVVSEAPYPGYDLPEWARPASLWFGSNRLLRSYHVRDGHLERRIPLQFFIESSSAMLTSEPLATAKALGANQ